MIRKMRFILDGQESLACPILYIPPTRAMSMPCYAMTRGKPPPLRPHGETCEIWPPITKLQHYDDPKCRPRQCNGYVLELALRICTAFTSVDWPILRSLLEVTTSRSDGTPRSMAVVHGILHTYRSGSFGYDGSWTSVDGILSISPDAMALRRQQTTNATWTLVWKHFLYRSVIEDWMLYFKSAVHRLSAQPRLLLHQVNFIYMLRYDCSFQRCRS